MIEFTLENILGIIIILITANLLFIGFYIIAVLREVKKTVSRAGEVIDEVDKTVKDGIEKANAIQAPLQALATTASAFGGIIKSSNAIKKATQSILGPMNGGASTIQDTVGIEQKNDIEITQENASKFFKKPKFFKVPLNKFSNNKE